MKNILVLCTGNSCRSQMAHGIIDRLADVHVYSAGVETHGLNPHAVEAMKKWGIDISHHTSNLVEEYEHIHFDVVFTVCDHAQERCPIFPHAHQHMHHNFSDPSKKEYSSDKERDQAYYNTVKAIDAFCTAHVLPLL